MQAFSNRQPSAESPDGKLVPRIGQHSGKDGCDEHAVGALLVQLNWGQRQQAEAVGQSLYPLFQGPARRPRRTIMGYKNLGDAILSSQC